MLISLSQEIIDLCMQLKHLIRLLIHRRLVEPRVANLIKDELAKENYAITLLELHGYHNITAAQAKEGITYADIFAAKMSQTSNKPLAVKLTDVSVELFGDVIALKNSQLFN